MISRYMSVLQWVKVSISRTIFFYFWALIARLTNWIVNMFFSNVVSQNNNVLSSSFLKSWFSYLFQSLLVFNNSLLHLKAYFLDIFFSLVLYERYLRTWLLLVSIFLLFDLHVLYFDSFLVFDSALALITLHVSWNIMLFSAV